MTASTHTSNVRQNHKYDMSFVNIKKKVYVSLVPCTVQLVVVNGAKAGWKFASVQTLFPRCLRYVHILK